MGESDVISEIKRIEVMAWSAELGQERRVDDIRLV
jgi:hypothetical protein